jgi:hypothetical protein
MLLGESIQARSAPNLQNAPIFFLRKNPLNARTSSTTPGSRVADFCYQIFSEEEKIWTKIAPEKTALGGHYVYAHPLVVGY